MEGGKELVGAATMVDMLGDSIFGDQFVDTTAGPCGSSLPAAADAFVCRSAGGVWVKGAIDSGDLDCGTDAGGVCVCVRALFGENRVYAVVVHASLIA